MFVLCLLCFVAVSCYTQKIRISSYGSYVLDGMYHIYYPDGDFYGGTINHGSQLGLGAEYMVTPNYGVELNCLKRYTTISPEEAANGNPGITALEFNYVLLGLNAYPQSNVGRLQAYGGVSTGVVMQTSFNMVNITNYPAKNVITKFAWAARLGGIFWCSNQVGVKLQTQWLSSLQFQNAAVNFDVHRLNGVVAESSIANQLEFGGGLIVKIGKNAEKINQ